MKTVYILRGLPGSGKSTLAGQLAVIANFSDEKSTVCSADHYFYNDKGEYNWDKSKLNEAHQQCRDQFEYACSRSYGIVICDNTNITHKEIRPYRFIAAKYNYEVVIITVGEFTKEACEKYAKLNSHAVPLEIIERMALKFQL